jgi:Uma2 family endonuclease
MFGMDEAFSAPTDDCLAEPPARFRLSVVDFHRMSETGVLTPETRVELIEGELLTMAPIGDAHHTAVVGLNALLVSAVAGRALVSPQGPLRLSAETELYPDLALFRRAEDFVAGETYTAANVLLVIEIADSSLAYDSGPKRALYATAGVPEYWLVNLVDQRIECHWTPRRAVFSDSHIALLGDTIGPRAFPELALPVSLILGC